MEASLTKDGQITIPVAIKDYLDIRAGQTVEFTIENGKVVMRKADCSHGKIIFGTMKGMIAIRDDFDEPIECFEEYT